MSVAVLSRKEVLILFVLIVFVMGSAIGVAFSVHKTRQKVADLSVVNKEYDELGIEWERLLLELSTFGGYSRIENKAIKNLGMTSPGKSNLRVIEIN